MDDRFNYSFFLERLKKKSWTCERKFLIILLCFSLFLFCRKLYFVRRNELEVFRDIRSKDR